MLNRISAKLGLAAMLVAVTLSVGVGIGLSQNIGITGTDTNWRNSIFEVGMLRVARTTAITAFAGGGQTSAVQLVYGLNRVSTVASANDSVKLPICLGGRVVTVINAAAANSLNVFGQTGETINALSANTAYAIAANKVVTFYCGLDGAWYSQLTASLDPFGAILAANDNSKSLRRAA